MALSIQPNNGKEYALEFSKVEDAPVIVTLEPTSDENFTAVLTLKTAPNACGTVLIHYPQNEKSFNNLNLNIALDPSSHLTVGLVQNQNDTSQASSTIIAEQNRNSTLNLFTLSFGSKKHNLDINAKLKEEGAVCHLSGLYLGNDDKSLTHNVKVDHLTSRTESHLFFKGIMDGHSKGVFTGRAVIHPKAAKCVAHQINKNLLLSKDAAISPKPDLEIYNDDVVASHGATVGQLDKNSLFYLRSRGLDEKTAINILTYAFAHDVLDKIENKELRDTTHKLLNQKLPIGSMLEAGNV
ncbi:Fe-S cluster assembly protein SufD [bacterium]|nr:Fe-S cluster assembly protein SufD [bacterium]